jgi:hypothetical protein
VIKIPDEFPTGVKKLSFDVTSLFRNQPSAGSHVKDVIMCCVMRAITSNDAHGTVIDEYGAMVE